MKVRLRLLDTHADYRRAEELQRIVWGFADREIIPLNDLVPTQKHGGCVVGAFDGTRLIGLCVGCPALGEDNAPYHYSRIMGVLPEYQDHGIGYRLKLFQRKQCLSQKLEVVRWTFDPLQARNAFFNLEKLGVIVREYTPNIYGDFSSSRFNSGLETDRFTPEWRLLSNRVMSRLGKTAPRLDFREVTTSGRWEPGFRARIGAKGLLQPIAMKPSRAPRLFAQIPADINELKRKDVTLARRWRRETRAFFLDAFRRGYVIHGFALDREGMGGAYILQKGLPAR